MCIGLVHLDYSSVSSEPRLRKEVKFVDSRIRAVHQVNFATKLLFDSPLSARIRGVTYTGLGFGARV